MRHSGSVRLPMCTRLYYGGPQERTQSDVR
jgi:hypothetical protein